MTDASILAAMDGTPSIVEPDGLEKLDITVSSMVSE
jgi:hypothetical protein